jgi:pyruvate-formate lyase-activating enzyme
MPDTTMKPKDTYTALAHEGGTFMATSSITRNFIISGQEQVERFVNALEESAQNRPIRTPVHAKFIETEDELRDFMEFRKMKEQERTHADNG